MKKQTNEEFLNQITKLHPTLDFSKAIYSGNLVPITIICKTCRGEFQKTPKGLKKGEGCILCSKDELRKKYALPQEEYIRKCGEKYGTRFGYSKVNYVNSGIKVIIHCESHGDFSILPLRFLNSDVEGCPKCSKEVAAKKVSLTTEEFIERSKKVHPGKFTYEKTNYINSSTKVTITCVKHGDMSVIPGNHFQGADCAICKNSNVQKTTEEFVQQAISLHGDAFDYSLVNYKSNKAKVNIICNKDKTHGVFGQTPRDHLTRKPGQGCAKCNGNSKSNTEDFIAQASIVHKNKYDYSKVMYSNNRNKVEIICPKPNHGSFFQQPIDHLHGENGCPLCAHTISKAQLDVEEFIISLGIAIERNKKLKNNREIDIFIPELNIGIEYNGLYWHSSDRVGKSYHLDKLNTCTNEGIRLVQIFEDEWIYKRNIVEAKLISILGKMQTRIFARNTKIVNLSWEQTREFLENTHVQGPGSSTVINLGLVDKENNICAIMTFSNLRFEKGTDTEYELIRFSSSINVVGGFSKLLKHFIKSNKVTKIVSYSDKRWSIGGVYMNNGFEWASESSPGYFWCKKDVRYNRTKFQKHKLAGVLKTFDSSLSETENCIANNYYKVYDCGMDKWVMKL